MSLTWILIRGSGIAAFGLLGAATVWGLLTSTKLLGKRVRAKPLTWFHESLGIGAVVATLAHIFFVSVDEFVEFSWTDILVPGSSNWRPHAISLGVMAMYGLVLVTVSFYFKKRIGQRVWRTIHFASLGVFVAATLHGIIAGTDTHNPLVASVYLGFALTVGLLIGVRLSGRRGSPVQSHQQRRASPPNLAEPEIGPNPTSGQREPSGVLLND